MTPDLITVIESRLKALAKTRAERVADLDAEQAKIERALHILKNGPVKRGRPTNKTIAAREAAST